MQRALLLLLVAVSFLLLAGGPRWTLPWILGVAAVAAATAPRATFNFPSATRSLDRALMAVAAGLALQLVPLPAPLVGVLSPHARPLRGSLRFAIANSNNAAWLPLSIDAEATAYALGTFVLGVLTFWVARATFSAGGNTRQFCRSLGLLAAIAALVAVVQKAVAPGQLMGFVTSEFRNANPLGPFLNRNHFAAWLLMCSAATVGYLTAHLHIHPAYRQRFRIAAKQFFASGALLSAIGVVVMLLTLLMTLSRSAAVGLGVAAATGGWLGRARLRVERTSLPQIFSAAGVVILIAAAFIDIEGWFTRIQHSMGVVENGFDRLTIWRESLPMVRDFPLTGIGGGAYSEAMQHYQQTRFWVGSMQMWAQFNNAHSHYVQLAAEGGALLVIPVATAIFFLVRLGLGAIRADKGEMFWVRVGAAAGLVGIAVQSIWEVPLVMPANTVLAGVLAGLLLHRRDASARSESATPSWTPPVTAGRA